MSQTENLATAQLFWSDNQPAALFRQQQDIPCNYKYPLSTRVCAARQMTISSQIVTRSQLYFMRSESSFNN